MSKTFTVTIGDSGTSEEYLKSLDSERLRHIIWNVSNLKMCEINVEEITVEQNCGTPIDSSKNIEKPLRLSGNLAWENRIEDSDDYIGDKMNNLIENR